MRDIEDIGKELNELKLRASLFKGWAALLAILAVGYGLYYDSFAVFLSLLLSALLVFAVWGGDSARMQRLEEEIEERSYDEKVSSYQTKLNESSTTSKEVKATVKLKRKIYEITTINKRGNNAKSTTTQIQKTKIIKCLNCEQKLKINIKEKLEIKCPTCSHKWIGIFKYNE